MALKNKNENKNKQNKHSKLKLLGVIPLLPLLLTFALIPLESESDGGNMIMIDDAITPIAPKNPPNTDLPKNMPDDLQKDLIPIMPDKGFDFPPTLHFFSDTQHTQTVAVLTAIASDTGDNAGIRWIKIYEDDSLLDSKDCHGLSSCTFSRTIIETMHASHSYYAKTKDKGNHVKQSEVIIIEFDGENHRPQIDSFVPSDTEFDMNVSDTVHFEIWASDVDDDSLSYSWTLDTVEVSTATSWDFTAAINDIGSHEVAVFVSDGEYEATQVWNVTVLKIITMCTLDFVPTSPINYVQQPFTASCSCTNPEAAEQLWRDSQDVTSENDMPVTLAANPIGYSYECNVSETVHYTAGSVSDNYIIEKGQTVLNLSAQPDWNVVYGTQTTVACTANNAEVVVELFRNGLPVSNPNIQTLTAGIYNYECNVLETENWTASSAVNTLNISKAASEVNLLVNGQDNDISVAVNDIVEINGTLIMPSKPSPNPSPNPIPYIIPINPIKPIKPIKPIVVKPRLKQQVQPQPGPTAKQHYIELYLDNILVDSGNYNVSYVTSFSSAGTHNATVVYPENENYTGSSETHFITVEADTEAPIVNLIDPIDGTTFHISNVTITYNVTDDLDMFLDCDIWSNTSGTWQIDAQQQVANSRNSSFNYTHLAKGSYIWNVECQDDSGNSAFAPTNWTFIIDVDHEPPVITFVPPTPANGSTIATNYAFINTTITDNVAVSKAILEWQGINETMSGSGTNFYVNKTGLADGTYTYKVYANDTSNNWNVSETRTVTVNAIIPVHDIAVESLTLLKEVNDVNVSIESSTAYLNDTVYVLALIHNLGNVNETVNITLQNNIGILDTKIMQLDPDQTNVASFVWNANPDGWHTIKVAAEPVPGETNFANNELSQDVLVWKVCDVIDCSVFGPRTASESYALGQPFRVKALMQNTWNNETFKDLKIELVVNPNLQIIAPWPAVQYFDLNESQFAIANWNVTSMNTGNYSITAWVGNREYNDIKYIEITP